MTDSAHYFFFILSFLLEDHIVREFRPRLVIVQDVIVVYSTIGDNVTQLFICVFAAEEEGMIVEKVEDLHECIEKMRTMALIGVAGALQLIPNRDLELHSQVL
jgi:hypothetical protein